MPAHGEGGQIDAPPGNAVHASLLHAGRRIAVGEAGAVLGRDETSDVALSGARASRRHACVYRDAAGQYVVADLDSRHGTELNGTVLHGEERPLESGDRITVDGELIRFIAGPETRIASSELPVLETQTVQLTGERLSIGRDPGNDLMLADPNVSRFHADVLAREGRFELIDLDSRNGTRVNGERVERAWLESDTEVGIGPYRLTFDGTSLVARDERGALQLDGRDVTIDVREKRILDRVSISVAPGELVAIIGESGSGKSTLIKALAGVSATSAGDVTANGDPIVTRLTDIGYVPQDDIVHRGLTVREALRYAARLRLPADTSEAEIDETVARVLEEVALGPHADTRVGALSGGQRKRTGVAAELLGRPSLLFLDEPTTGLDPGLESRMMALLRDLANDSRAVVVVTHATKNLGLCDRVAVMGRGGNLTYYGPPHEATEFFGTSDYDGVYDALEQRPATEWRERFEQQAGAQAAAAAPRAQSAPSRASGRAPAQAFVLTSRYVKLMLRDRRNLALLIGQVPLLALANVGLFKSGIFDRPGGSPADAVQLLFMLVITVIWLGAIDASREVVKERGVLEREAAVGVPISAYLASKVFVLFALVALQTLLFAGIVLAFRPLDAPTSDYLAVLALLVMTGFAAVSMGLAISALVSTEDQATSLTPLAVIPQLLFAGAIVPVAQMGAIVKALSYVMFSQWSLAAVGTAAEMNSRIAEDPAFARAARFGPDFFDVPAGAGLLVLAAFGAVFIGCTALLLARSLRR